MTILLVRRVERQRVAKLRAEGILDEDEDLYDFDEDPELDDEEPEDGTKRP